MKKVLKKIWNKAKNILVVIALCSIVFLGTKIYDKSHIKPIEVIKEVPTEKIIEKKVEISGETIQAGMENIGKLCTAEYSYTHVEHENSAREIKGFEIPFTTSSFIYSYDGTIMAGIDFAKIQIDKDDIEKVIIVTLPDVEIISSDVDQNSFELYDEKNNIFNPISVADVAGSFHDLKSSEEAKAIEKGLFEKAKENAVTLVKNFMCGSYDVKDYDIEVVFDTTKK